MKGYILLIGLLLLLQISTAAYSVQIFYTATGANCIGPINYAVFTVINGACPGNQSCTGPDGRGRWNQIFCTANFSSAGIDRYNYGGNTCGASPSKITTYPKDVCVVSDTPNQSSRYGTVDNTNITTTMYLSANCSTISVENGTYLNDTCHLTQTVGTKWRFGSDGSEIVACTALVVLLALVLLF